MSLNQLPAPRTDSPFASRKGHHAPTDDGFFVELLGDGVPGPIPEPVYTDLGDSLCRAFLCDPSGNLIELAEVHS